MATISSTTPGGNYYIAKQKFEVLKNKFRRDATFYSRYNNVVEDFLKQGMAEDVPRDNTVHHYQAVRPIYLPHHAVVRE